MFVFFSYMGDIDIDLWRKKSKQFVTINSEDLEPDH